MTDYKAILTGTKASKTAASLMALRDGLKTCENHIAEAHFMINRAQVGIFEATTDYGTQLWFAELKSAQSMLRDEVGLQGRLLARIAHFESQS